VVTVGAFHGGTRPNIIPDTAELQLTVRAYEGAVRDRLLSGIQRIAKAEAEAANAPQPPEGSSTSVAAVTANDPAVAAPLAPAGRQAPLGCPPGDARAVERTRVRAAEDFCESPRAGTPAVTIQLGATAPEVFAKAKAEGTVLPSLHSSLFAPDAKPAVTTGIE